MTQKLESNTHSLTKIHEAMTARYNYLFDMVNRDFGGGSETRNAELREVKYWKEAIERGEFD